MFRDMRRKGQKLTEEEAIEILKRGPHGVLALSGDDDYPYALPISYVYDDGRIIFHSAITGHKIDAIRKSSKASFCVVDKDDVVPELYTTKFRSVIAFGRIEIVNDDERKLEDIKKLAVKYAPMDTEEHMESYIQKDWKALCMLELQIEHLSGKEGKELVAEKAQ